MSMRNSISLLVHAFIGWALCGATMGICMATTSMQNALVIHAVAAPIIFAFVSGSYFRRPGSLAPLLGATAFVVFVVAMDFFVVALLINRSLDMFASLLGTWIPFVSIFASTCLTGFAVVRHASASDDSRERLFYD